MNDIVNVSAAPLIPDLTFRRFRGPRDLAGIAALHRARADYDELDPLAPGQRSPNVNELAKVYTSRLDFDPQRQMLMAEMRGKLIGYAWFRAWPDAEGRWMLVHRVLIHPEWRSKGIGLTLMRWAELALTEIARQRPQGTAAFLRTDVYSTERETIDRLAATGYQIGHSDVELALPTLSHLPDAVAPEGFELRPPRPSEYEAAYAVLAGAFVTDWDHSDQSEDDFVALMESPTNDPTLWRIAMMGDQIVGVILCEAIPPAGIISELAVSAAWRRRGLGHALLVSGLYALRERGLTEARAYTDAANPFGARTLYERLGFHPIKEVLAYLRPL